MKATFEKQKFNTSAVSEETYVKMFADLGFQAKRVAISFTNGCSAYITLEVKVLNLGQMWAETFVYDGYSTIQVRVSDHPSNLEVCCGGVSNNKMSFAAFKILVDKKVIENAD